MHARTHARAHARWPWCEKKNTLPDSEKARRSKPVVQLQRVGSVRAWPPVKMTSRVVNSLLPAQPTQAFSKRPLAADWSNDTQARVPAGSFSPEKTSRCVSFMIFNVNAVAGSQLKPTWSYAAIYSWVWNCTWLTARILSIHWLK